MVFTKSWFQKTAVRCIKTFAEVMLANMSVGQAFGEVSWAQAASCAGVASIVCFATCIVSLPENKDSKEA